MATTCAPNWCAKRGTASLRAPVAADVNLGLRQYSVYPADWRPRFADAYRRQNRAWINSVTTGKPNIGASAWDGYCSTAIAAAGVEALTTGGTVAVRQIARPQFYA